MLVFASRFRRFIDAWQDDVAHTAMVSAQALADEISRNGRCLSGPKYEMSRDKISMSCGFVFASARKAAFRQLVDIGFTKMLLQVFADFGISYRQEKYA